MIVKSSQPETDSLIPLPVYDDRPSENEPRTAIDLLQEADRALQIAETVVGAARARIAETLQQMKELCP